ncbi:serine/threonine protein kinase [Steroidobacter sp. S1-65]|uniref:Serine/threonine protein kinase n=1 Tax=Steroidobacter gossypii TaxID=2805490 RepID=A0ABS1WQI1_9GAMM|nr:serine/threonine-protein kinase [Steroidobacter gossypii]MBM0103223.1 serine/threonine protein kinase [Steroidobacter gossypii]
MNKEGALASLGLNGDEDHATVARVYGERLVVVQDQLASAQTDAERNEQSAKLAELSEAYELITGSGRYTQLRSGTALASMPAGDTFVRMEPGVVIADRFEIGELLGQGGMGNVYAAHDRLKNQDIAMKVLRQDLQFSGAAKDRFLAEARGSCSLSHPNIVRVHDVGVSGGLYYLSMERLHGHTLRQRMDQYRQSNREFSIAEVTDIARQLTEALRYAHRYIVHRDIKPENIWLAEDGTLKLMDFGIARAFSDSQLTQTGMVLGTAYYMSPEQRIGSKEIDWRADQYAMGVVLYELFAGTLPMGAVRPIDTIRRDLPKRYANALMRAMAVLPEDRFQSLNDMLAEIEAPPPKKFRYGSLVLIGAGLAAAAAGAFVILNNQGRAPQPTAVAQAPKAEPAAASAAAAAGGTEASNRGGGPDGSAPVEPPPPGETSALAAALPEQEPERPTHAVEQSAADVVSETPSPPIQRVARATTIESAPSSSAGGGIDARRQQCIAQCERDDGECRSLSRRGKQECMRAVAFGGNSARITTTNPAATSCAFFGQSRCDYSLNRDACLARMTTRYKTCVEVLGGSVASRRQDCDDNARESDQMCLDELRECRASCE